MKLCIPYPERNLGGMHTFLKYFKDYLRKHHIFFTPNIFSKYDVLFIISFMTPVWKVWLTKLLHPNIKIIQRIDGSAEDYGRGSKWDRIQSKVNKLADITIFQSEYSKYATREKFKVIKNDGPVIYNPVDTELFKPGQELMNGEKP